MENCRYLPLRGPNDMILCVFDTFIRTDRFRSLTENDVTGGADLVCYFLDLFYVVKGRF